MRHKSTTEQSKIIAMQWSQIIAMQRKSQLKVTIVTHKEYV